MKYYLRRAKIKGLFEQRYNLTIDFDEGTNCIHGVNGSGKTTVIKLIVSALLCDVTALSRLPFNNIEVLISKHGQVKPHRFLEISKESDQIIYSTINDVDKLTSFHLTTREDDSDQREHVKSYLASKLILTYIPLLRMHDNEMSSEAIDDFSMKMAFLRNQMTKPEIYSFLDPSVRVLSRIQEDLMSKYAEIQNQINQELEKLKDKIIEKVLIDEAFSKKAENFQLRMQDAAASGAQEYPAEKVDDLLKQFERSRIKISSKKIKEHFQIWNSFSSQLHDSWERVKLENEDKNEKDRLKSLEEYSKIYFQLLSLTSLYERFLSIVEDVKSTEDKRNELFHLFDLLATEINGFLINKEFKFLPNGRFVVTCNGREVQLSDLSSGEKHIIAILGRVTLSPSEGSVFIADEPELSLHLDWQRKIMNSIQSLSPKMQIIVATHSPAIIPKGARIIDLEECKND